MLNLLDVDDKIKEEKFPLSFVKSGKSPEIEFRDVRFAYDGANVIDGVSFKVGSGESIGIVGQTGSGKSTLMRLLYRFYDIKTG